MCHPRHVPAVRLAGAFVPSGRSFVVAFFDPYEPSLWFGAVGFGCAIFSVVAAALTGPKRYNRARLEAYECGIEPPPQAVGGGHIPIKYFLTAMLFIVFDIEIVFLYPWAVSFDHLGLFGLFEMLIFIATVFVPYA